MTPQHFLKSTAVQRGGVLQYKWEVYAVGFPFPQGIEARKAWQYNWGGTAVQIVREKLRRAKICVKFLFCTCEILGKSKGGFSEGGFFK